MDDSKFKLKSFLSSVERHQKKCQKLTDFLKIAKSSLNLQLRDVTVVDDVSKRFFNKFTCLKHFQAYEKFEKGIQETKKQLEEIIKDGKFVPASPPRNAPSPQPNDEQFISGINLREFCLLLENYSNSKRFFFSLFRRHGLGRRRRGFRTTGLITYFTKGFCCTGAYNSGWFGAGSASSGLSVLICRLYKHDFL